MRRKLLENIDLCEYFSLYLPISIMETYAKLLRKTSSGRSEIIADLNMIYRTTIQREQQLMSTVRPAAEQD